MEWVEGYCGYCPQNAAHRTLQSVTTFLEYVDEYGRPHFVPVCKQHLGKMRALFDGIFDDEWSAAAAAEIISDESA